LYSSLSPGFTDAGSVVGQIQAEMTNFDAPKSIKFDFTGHEEQNAQKTPTTFFVTVGDEPCSV
jgi:hypothetical protein